MKYQQKKVSLARALSKLGFTSRKKAIELIINRQVSVNDQIIDIPNFRVDIVQDKIVVEGKNIQRKKYIYLILNKPSGYITTRVDELGRKTVYDLLEGIQEWIFPVGRLDKDTKGLLIFTNDNKFGELLTNPDYEVSKTYIAKIDKEISDLDLKYLRSGVTILKNYKTLPAEVKIINKDKTKLRITISEGKNRQIRRMFETLGYSVIELKRISIGNVNLGNLKEGKWRFLNEKEVKKLRGI